MPYSPLYAVLLILTLSLLKYSMFLTSTSLSLLRLRICIRDLLSFISLFCYPSFIFSCWFLLISDLIIIYIELLSFCISFSYVFRKILHVCVLSTRPIPTFQSLFSCSSLFFKSWLFSLLVLTQLLKICYQIFEKY